MASQTCPKFEDYIPTKQELVEAVLEFVTKKLAGQLQGSDRILSSPVGSTPLPAVSIRCVRDLLSREPDHVYRFDPNNLNAHAPERPSFMELVKDWRRADKQRRDDGGSFPEVRRKRAADHFIDCTLRCMCDICSEGEAVQLDCKPRRFGSAKDVQDEVLVHEFTSCGQTWAVILGTWETPEEYRLWGSAWKDDPNATAYYEGVILKEIYGPGMGDNKRQRESPSVASESGEHSESEEDAIPPQKRRRTAASNKREPRSLLPLIGDDGEDYDDEEDIPLYKLWLSRTKSTPQSAKFAGRNTAPDSPTSPLTRQMNATLQRPYARDLEQIYQSTMEHMLEQTDSDGLKIIINNDIIQRHLNALQKHAHDNDEVLFQAMQSSLNQKLMEVGIPSLPNM